MNPDSSFSKHIDTITKEEFLALYSSMKPEDIFSENELQKFKSPANSGSLAGRYLIKKSICQFIGDHQQMSEIEILNNDFGKPEVFFGVNIRKKLEIARVKNVCCSISHSKNYITGMTIFSF
jgi:phosphopantetheine--protein transferase-like protein